MAHNLPTLSPFDAGNNPSESWRHWKEDFQDFLEALKYRNEPESTKTALFRHVCGDELKKQYRSFDLKPAAGSTEVSLKQVLEEFDKYFADYQNEIYASFKFLEIKQEKGEKFADFYSRLRSAVIECNYGDAAERMIRDKIVQGLSDKALQERLIRETNRSTKTLQNIIGECKAAEHSKAQATEMNENCKLTVDALKKNKHRSAKQTGKQMSHTSSREKECSRCGSKHQPKKCPAYGTSCRKCGGKNHWEKMCRAKKQQRRLDAVERNAEDSESEIVYLGEVKTLNELETNETSVWYQNIVVNGNKVNFKLDTGAQVNVIPKNELLKWSEKPVVKKSKQPVLDYSENQVPILGECLLTCEVRKITKTLKFLVTTLESSPILGLQACQSLGLIKRVYQVERNKEIEETPDQVLQEYADVFTGVGRLNHTVKIKLKENSLPHIAAPRKVPLAIHTKVKDELNRMVDNGIITAVEEPTEWVSNMVVVNTPKKLRICLDPRPLNKVIQRPHYPIPTAESLILKLQGCKIFTILDAKNGFWQLPLDKESSYLTTFTTPWGRYRFLVLPFGLNCAPEEFQRAMNGVFGNDPQINPYFDDIALGSRTIQEHCQLLRTVLEKARKANLKLNLEKTQLALPSVNYLGHVLSDKGITPDPNKIKAINEFAVPKCKEDLQRFLGMVTYLAKFTPHLSDLTHPLRQLLKQECTWIWDKNTDQAFGQLKKAIAQAPCLQYFNEDKPVTISVDSSSKGLGAVLLQEDKPVAYGSAALTETQQRYAQIEKELLAVIYGLEHFNYYTYGRQVTVQTDHKPLIGLSSKHYDTISPRLQRLLLRLNKYNAKLVYIPGKCLLIADALSRAYSEHDNFKEETEEEEVSVKINLIVTASTSKWEDFAVETKNDEELQAVIYHVKYGWPEKNKTKMAAQAYWHCKEELFYSKEGIVCRGQRLVVPVSRRQEVLKKVHITHRGIVACKIKAREYFYWPGINEQIENMISKCTICQKHQNNNRKEVLLDQELPTRPWQKVGCDFFYLRKQQYLLMVDYFSKFIEVKNLRNNTASAVKEVMKSIFASHGIPEELVSDGGPPFTSDEFKKFCKEWNVEQTITSPNFPRSHGQVERAVGTLKKSLIKADEEGKDLHTVLLDYRITPTNGLPSPAELLMGRRLRSFLPSHPSRLKPKFPISEAVKSLKKRQEIQNKYANRSAVQHSQLQNNAKVWFRKKPTEAWKQGTIIKCGPNPRSYMIRGKDGSEYRRNRFHIRPDTTSSSCDNTSWTRTTEDLHPTPNEEETVVKVPQSDLNKQALNNQQQSVRKSNRTVVKPARYRDN